jgi:hypothetical protein
MQDIVVVAGCNNDHYTATSIKCFSKANVTRQLAPVLQPGAWVGRLEGTRDVAVQPAGQHPIAGCHPQQYRTGAAIV